MVSSSIILENVSAAVIAHIGAVRGEVLILRALGGFQAAQKGDPIYEDDIVSTKENGTALVYSGNGSVLTFGSSAAVQFNPSLIQKMSSDFKNGSLGLGQGTPFDALEKLIEEGENLEATLAPTAGNKEVLTDSKEISTSTEITVWERVANEIVPVSGFRVANASTEIDFFGNQLGNRFVSNDPDIFASPQMQKSDDAVVNLLSADDALVVQEDSENNTGSVASNDSSTSDAPLSFALLSGSNTQHGELVFNVDGTYTYTPDANFNGSDSFQYVVTDTGSNSSAVQTVVIAVKGVNDLPVAQLDNYSVDEDNTLSGNVLSNDSDIDGKNTLAVNTNPVSDVSNGDLVINANGTFTYTPNINFNGVDTFVYEVNDGNGGTAQATATITVNAVADIPVANNDTYSTNEDTTLSTTLLNGVLLNDTDGDGDALMVNASPITDVSNGVLVLNTDGTFTYTPDANFNGVDTFVYEVSDGSGGTAQATATITVESADDLVTASETESESEDTPVVSTVSTGDSTSSGGSLTYSLVSGPSSGTLSSAINAITGNYTYTPNADFVGSDSFQYLVTDASSGESSIETVSITVNPVVDLIAMDDTLTVPFETLTAGDVSINDSTTSAGGNGGLVYSLVANVSDGTLVFNADGSYTYISTTIGDIGGSDSFTYLVTDAASGESLTQTVTLTIDPANSPPEGADISKLIVEDNSYTFLEADFGFSDPVEGDTFTGVRIDTLPSLGTLAVSGIAVTLGQIVDVADITGGNLVFTPAVNGNGSPYSSFTFSVQDSAGSIDPTPNTVTINVTPVADLPVAGADSYSVIQNTPFTTTLANGVLLNDSDGDGDTLTVDTTPVVNVGQGTLILNADGTFTYTPTDGYNGPDSFTYEIDDGTGNTTQATVNITVTDYPSNTVIGTSAGDEWGASLIGAAASDDDIYSGGVMEGQRENVQGVAGTISEAQVHIVGSGNDRFILDADDTFSTDAKNADGQIRLRGFSIGDVTTDVDADTLVLGDFLRAGDPTFDGTAADAVRFFHFAGNLEFYLDREGGLGASGDAARVLEDGTYGGVAGGSSLFFEIKTHYSFADTTPDGTTLNSEAQIQALMDLGFLDFS